MHIYQKNGKEYPSVTTIIHNILLYPEPLLEWSNFMGLRKKLYKKCMEESSTLGTCVHDMLYHYIKGDNNTEVKVPFMFIDKVNTILATAIPHLKSIGITPENTLYAEETIISEKLGYAGTLDWTGTCDSTLSLIDYKTSKKARENMFIQLAGYDKLLQVEKGIKVNQAMILTVREDKVTPYKLTRNDLDFYYEIFVHMHAIFDALGMLEKLKEVKSK